MPRGKAISSDLRKIITDKSSTGKSAYAIAAELNIPRSSIRNIIRLNAESGCPNKKLQKTRKSLITASEKRMLSRICTEHRNSSTVELTSKWNAATGKCASISTTWRTMKKLGFGFYKVSFICI